MDINICAKNIYSNVRTKLKNNFCTWESHVVTQPRDLPSEGTLGPAPPISKLTILISIVIVALHLVISTILVCVLLMLRPATCAKSCRTGTYRTPSGCKMYPWNISTQRPIYFPKTSATVCFVRSALSTLITVPPPLEYPAHVI